MSASEQMGGAAHGARVLVVDDEASMAETLVDALEERGYVTTAVGSSVEAAALLERDDVAFDAVVTDLRMPGVDGLEIVSIAKTRAPERPVIVMTAFGSLDRAVESLRRGAYHYLNKPFKVDALALYLERALEDARMRREVNALRQAVAALRGGLAG